MKKTIIALATLLTVLSLTACTSEQIREHKDDIPVPEGMEYVEPSTEEEIEESEETIESVEEETEDDVDILSMTRDERIEYFNLKLIDMMTGEGKTMEDTKDDAYYEIGIDAFEAEKMGLDLVCYTGTGIAEKDVRDFVDFCKSKAKMLYKVNCRDDEKMFAYVGENKEHTLSVTVLYVYDGGKCFIMIGGTEETE